MELSIQGRLTGARFDTYEGQDESLNTLYLLFDDCTWPFGYISISNVDPTMGRGIVTLVERANGREPKATPSNPRRPQPTQQLPGNDEIPF